MLTGRYGDSYFRGRRVDHATYIPEIATTTTALGRPHWKCAGTPKPTQRDAENIALDFIRSIPDMAANRESH